MVKNRKRQTLLNRVGCDIEILAMVRLVGLGERKMQTRNGKLRICTSSDFFYEPPLVNAKNLLFPV